MNFLSLFIFLILQVVVNRLLGMFIPTDSLYGVLAFYLCSCFIISFIAALFATPRGYKKEFFRQPYFHKTMLIYFVCFLSIDLLLFFFTGA